MDYVNSADKIAEHFQRARVLRSAGKLADALLEWRRALSLAPRHPVLLNNYGLTLIDDARYDEAVAVLVHAAACLPGAAPWVNLGNALRSLGRKHEARVAYQTALRREPIAAAYFNLHATLYAAPTRAVEALALALECKPSHHDAQFHLGALLHEVGLLTSLPAACDFMVDSYRFTREHPTAQHFGDTFDLLRHALWVARQDGDVVELGVRRGASIRRLARWCDHVHGFDAFEGLPDTWGDQPAGLYATGACPDVPDNVTLHVGWFSDTLPQWKSDAPLRLVNVDCDIYRSTLEALQHLAPRIGAGTVLVFDEYLCNPGWQNEEHRALLEVAAQFGWNYQFVAFSLFTKQAAIRLC
jgi:hypothetical protein